MSLTVDPLTDPQQWTTVSGCCHVILQLSKYVQPFLTLCGLVFHLQTVYQGASFRAMYYMGLHKGYALVATDRIGVNMFFI